MNTVLTHTKEPSVGDQIKALQVKQSEDMGKINEFWFAHMFWSWFATNTDMRTHQNTGVSKWISDCAHAHALHGLYHTSIDPSIIMPVQYK